MHLVSKTRFTTSIAIALLIIATPIIINKINVEEEKIQSQKVDISTSNFAQKVNLVQIENVVEQEPKKIYYDIPLSEELQDYIRETCKKYDVDMENILAIMKTESDFKQDVKSKNQSENGYSVGYMQLNTGNKDYIKWYGELTNIQNFNPMDEKQNIEGGIAVYKFYKSYWENKGYSGEELLIRSYNTYNLGLDGFKKYIRNTGTISRGYDRKISKYKEELTIK